MRLLLLFLPLIFFQQSWELFNSYDGKFQVYVPGTLQEKVDSLDTTLGKMAYHTFYYNDDSAEADNHIYTISYCDYPKGIIFADSTGLTDDFFDATVEEATFSVNGDLVYSTDVELEGYPGKFWRIDYLDGEAVIKTKAYLVDNRYYAIQVISFRKGNINPSTNRFFDSFKLIGNRP